MAKQWWKPSNVVEGERGKIDGLMWYKDLGHHSCGEFSTAVIQANSLLEDQTQIESGPLGTFVGVYDGHGGPEAARFINNHLFSNLNKFAAESDEISTSVIEKAFSATDKSFLSLVKKQWQEKPHMASVGSCCLVGLISNSVLYVGNAGDSRAVLGRADDRNPRKIKAIQLSEEHNASYESVRDELRSRHPEDPDIVVVRHNVWRVKGIIQVSRSIGDAFLKRVEFNREPLERKFRLQRPFQRPILTSEPSVIAYNLQPQDRFLVFASDGLWEHLSSQDVVDIVAGYPSRGISRRLIKAALKEAAKKREMRYSDLKKIGSGVRRHFHDDITVVVVFLDHSTLRRSSPMSLKGPV